MSTRASKLQGARSSAPYDVLELNQTEKTMKTKTIAAILCPVYLAMGAGLHLIQYVPGHEWLAFYPCDLFALFMLVVSMVHFVLALGRE